MQNNRRNCLPAAGGAALIAIGLLGQPAQAHGNGDLLSGRVTAPADRAKVGLPARSAAEKSGDATAVVLPLGDSVLSYAGIVVVDDGQVQENIIIRLIRIILGR